jgi:hypothetical protein
MNDQKSQGQPLTQTIRSARKSARAITYIISVLFLHAVVVPDVSAVQDGLEKARQAEAIVLQGTPEQKMNQGLLKLQELSERKKTKLAERIGDEGGATDAVLSFFGLSQMQLEDVEQLQTLSTLIQEQHQQAVESFQTTREQLVAKNVAPEILQRHEDMVEKYTTRYADMSQRLQILLSAKDLREQQEAADALHQFMKSQKLKKSHQFTDPNNLPWGTPNPDKTRKPAESKRELEHLTGISPMPQGTQLATNVITPDMLGQPGGPVAEDLAETPDIKLTEAIKDKAEALDHDPVTIYNWVRNNIEFLPSYGSIQGADYTLQSGKGNAFDTASLLIALYRASNIPARYAYGTVDIPAEKAMNWVGGVDVPEAAHQLLGQGGIPNVAMISGGKISHVRMEHVWVEAWVDYLPSRAAKHKVGDTWVPLDASFKQYEFTEGQDIASNVHFDAEGLVDSTQANATLNETEGWIQGVNQADVQATIKDYQLQIQDYIANQDPDTTIGDVLGTQKVIVQEFQQLAAGLPYKMLVRTHNYSQLPSSLRHKFRYTLGTEYHGLENSRSISFEKSLPELAGKKLALSFKPTSQADEDLISSYIPENDPSAGEIGTSQLPNSLPGYLINLTAEFTEDGAVIRSGDAGTMGGELYETLALWSPGQRWQRAVNHPVAGEYRAIGLSLQGASAEQAQKLEAEVKATKSVLESADEAQVGALTKQEVLGDLLYATIFSYFALNEVQNQYESRSMGVVNYRLPSYGIFSTSLETNYWFGVPRSVSFVGLSMDVDRLATQTASIDNDKAKRLNFVKAMGMKASALEHLLPERVFSSENVPAQGISAVKALALASTEGQKIWSINTNNVDVALSSITLDPEIEVEILNAVRSGKIVATHERPVEFAGGTNAGYIMIDPETGGGAYKIHGGTNGGLLRGVEYVISILGMFYGVLNAVAGHLGSAVPFLNKITQYLAIAKFVSSLLRAGLDCPNQLDAVLFFITLTTVLALLVTQLVLGLANPLAAFAVGVGLDVGFSALTAATQNCSR